jgi:hypothetical protein
MSNGVRYVTIKRFAELSGYSEAAVRQKIHTGVWLIDHVWVKAPDGRILIDIQAFERWVEKQGVP